MYYTCDFSQFREDLLGQSKKAADDMNRVAGLDNQGIVGLQRQIMKGSDVCMTYYSCCRDNEVLRRCQSGWLLDVMAGLSPSISTTLGQIHQCGRDIWSGV